VKIRISDSLHALLHSQVKKSALGMSSPPIPFIKANQNRSFSKEFKKAEVKLHPDDLESPSIKKKVLALETGDVETWVDWHMLLAELAKDLQLGTVAKKVALCMLCSRAMPRATARVINACAEADQNNQGLPKRQQKSEDWAFLGAADETGRKCFNCEHACCHQVDCVRHELHFGGEGELEFEPFVERLLTISNKLPCFPCSGGNADHPHCPLLEDEIVGTIAQAEPFHAAG
jgi:hypothetical protein